MAIGACGLDTARALSCRDSDAATHLKLVSLLIIFFTSVIGIASPVVLARYFHGKPLYDKAILVIKCFAAGVILSTSLVHVLPEAYAALVDCKVAANHPWKDFPFAGLVTLVGALLALFVDITASDHIGHGNSGHEGSVGGGSGGGGYLRVGSDKEVKKEVMVVGVGGGSGRGGYLRVGDDKEVKKEEVTVVGVGGGSGGGGYLQVGNNKEVKEATVVGVDVDVGTEDEDVLKMKQKLVSQVLEIGIIFHSVIIGVTMGMSQNKCTIRPLVAALAFHQIFEGMGLGGCIAQAGFSLGTTAYMCFMFAVTTPMGIVMGMIVFSLTGYDDGNSKALIMEGLLGSLSSGILIYMGLVDLVAVDFFHNKLMSSTPFLKKLSFIALALGSTFMSILALWA